MMNIQLDPIISEFETTEQQQAYEAWFRAKVEKAMNDTRPAVPHDQVVAMFKKRREKRVK